MFAFKLVPLGNHPFGDASALPRNITCARASVFEDEIYTCLESTKVY